MVLNDLRAMALDNLVSNFKINDVNPSMDLRENPKIVHYKIVILEIHPS